MRSVLQKHVDLYVQDYVEAIIANDLELTTVQGKLFQAETELFHNAILISVTFMRHFDVFFLYSAKMTLEEIKRNGCSAAFALPVFFSFYSGLTLFFGGMATIQLKTAPSDATHFKIARVCAIAGAALIAFALCYIVFNLWLIPAYSRSWLSAKLRLRSFMRRSNDMMFDVEEKESEANATAFTNDFNTHGLVSVCRIKAIIAVNRVPCRAVNIILSV